MASVDLGRIEFAASKASVKVHPHSPNQRLSKGVVNDRIGPPAGYGPSGRRSGRGRSHAGGKVPRVIVVARQALPFRVLFRPEPCVQAPPANASSTGRARQRFCSSVPRCSA